MPAACELVPIERCEVMTTIRQVCFQPVLQHVEDSQTVYEIKALVVTTVVVVTVIVVVVVLFWWASARNI